MSFLEKIQNLSSGKKKIILWATVVVFGAGLCLFWTLNVKKAIADFQTEEIRRGMERGKESIKNDLRVVPKIEIPEEGEKKLQELLKESKGEINDQKEEQ